MSRNKPDGSKESINNNQSLIGTQRRATYEAMSSPKPNTINDGKAGFSVVRNSQNQIKAALVGYVMGGASKKVS